MLDGQYKKIKKKKNAYFNRKHRKPFGKNKPKNGNDDDDGNDEERFYWQLQWKLQNKTAEDGEEEKHRVDEAHSLISALDRWLESWEKAQKQWIFF